MDRKPITTDRSIASHKPEQQEYLVPVKNCPKLYLRVRPTGSSSWVFRYYSPITKKPRKMTLGAYPDVSLASARTSWHGNNELISQNVDPADYRKEKQNILLSKINNNFNHFAWEHFEELKKTHKANTITRKKGRYKLLCSYLGNMPIDEIEPPKMLEVLIDIQNNSVNAKGKITDKAERCAGIASDIFKYAGARGFCKTNPADMVKGQLSTYHYGHRPAVTKPDDLANLLRKIETLKVEPNTLNSLRLLAMLFVRNGDLRRVKWTDLDLDDGKWYLTPLKGEGKENMVRKMVIPLPKQAVDIFKEQEKINGNRDFIFFSASARKHKIISENNANNKLKDLGYQGIHCVHGFRATAKTILQEHLKYPLLTVEMALGHVSKDPNGNAYGRFEFFDDRAEMMQNWANYLDALREGEDTSKFKNRGTVVPSPTDQLQMLIDTLGKDKVMAMLSNSNSDT